MLPDLTMMKIAVDGGNPTEAATERLAAAALSHAEDKWLRNAVLSGVGGRELAFLRALLRRLPAETKVGPGLAAVFGYLGGTCEGPADLEVATGAPEAVRLALLTGYLGGAARKAAGLPVSFRALLDASPKVAMDEAKTSEDRVVAVKLMACLPWEQTGETLLRLALEDATPDLADAALKMSISYHLAWDVAPRTPGRFVQLVSLQRRAYHAGGEGNDWIGIALSGPWTQDPRSEREREAFEALLGVLCDSFGGSLRWWCRHSDITPGKRDPGPGFSEEWVGGRLTWRRGPRG
jgi:hypothetical protein